MSDAFYRAFEEKYRGTRELILSRLAIYRPFILPLKAIYPAAPAIDLGCGRGEWLQFLLGEGFLPLGIDQDDGMLQGCREQNLPAEQGDAVAYLSTLPNDSQAVISAFHVAEHISFDQLRSVVSEAHRVLKPGGLLIMETPNPENIVVATRKFYLDPTHLRPIPPELLSFLPEFYGFSRTKIMRIQESQELATNESPRLNDVLGGVSPDYAVVAQKTAPIKILELFDQPFNQEYGLSLNTLAERYDVSIETRAAQAESRAAQAESRAAQAESHIADLLNSTSWCVTAPLRWAGSAVSAMRGAVTPNALKSRAEIFLKHAALYVARRPRLKNAVLVALSRFPGLKSRVFHVVTGIRVQPPQPRNVPTEIAHLTPRARQIHADLKDAIERRRKENG